MATPAPSAEQPTNQVDMDEILSSIRSGVAEETAKVGETEDLINAAAAQDDPEAPAEAVAEAATDAAEEDILELSAAEMVPEEPTESAAPADAVVDLAAFGANGSTTLVAAPPVAPLTENAPADAAALADELLNETGATPAEAAPAEAPAPAASEDDFDKLLAEMSTQKEQKAAEVEQNKQELLAAEEPLGDVAALAATLQPEATQPEDVAPEPEAEAAVDMLPEEPAPAFTLGLVETENGPQVAFPAEVLAMALRPMVQKWLAENLPNVVDKLVKEEISKMTQS